MPPDRWRQSPPHSPFSPIIIGLCAKFRRFISCAAMHIISVLPGSNFVVADSAAVLFYHPDAVLLRRINALRPACQPFQVEVGNVWCEPSYFGRTKQLNLRLYIVVSRSLNCGDCSSSHSETRCGFRQSWRWRAVCPAVAHLDVVAMFSSFPMDFIMSGQVLCRACFNRCIPS